MKTAKILTMTYLSTVSFASLNGSDKEADNISSIKKITVGTQEFPYVSSQAIRRAIKDQLEVLGWKLSEYSVATIKKGVGAGELNPTKNIDDDLFGYMNATKGEEDEKGTSIKRTSPVRVTPLIAQTPYQGDLDFGTNFASVKAGGNPNIFETEIHSGLYRGTILIELDRVGSGDGFEKPLDNKEKAIRVKSLLSAIKNLWTSGRQSRFLSDISPKFIVGSMLKTKNPIFLESVCVNSNKINSNILKDTIKDYNSEIVSLVIGVRKGIIDIDIENTKGVGEAFDEMQKWIDLYYQE